MISITKNENTITLSIQADLINTSAISFDLVAFKRNILLQANAVYNNSFGKYRVTLKLEVRILTNVHHCSPKKVLFQIAEGITGGNPAEADLKGLRIKLNPLHVNEIISGVNFRTIPHEIGHLFGWNHPHARGTFESINTEAHPLEQQLTEQERQCNLMSQTWYPQRVGLHLQRAMSITEKQIDVLLEYYFANQLNKNHHLRYFLFWKKIV